MTVVLLSAVSILGSSCGATFYHARFPILEKPDRPQLKDIPGSEMKKMEDPVRLDTINNFNLLINHIRKLEVTLDMYNSHANEQNKILDTMSDPKKKKPGLIKRVFN
jgi:hypothetical protein